MESLRSGTPFRLPLWDRASAEFCFARSRDLLTRNPLSSVIDSSTEVLDSLESGRCRLSTDTLGGSLDPLSEVASSSTLSTSTLKGSLEPVSEKQQVVRLIHRRTVSDARVPHPNAPVLPRRVPHSTPASPLPKHDWAESFSSSSSSSGGFPTNSWHSKSSNSSSDDYTKKLSSESSSTSSSEDLRHVPGFTEDFLKARLSTKF